MIICIFYITDQGLPGLMKNEGAPVPKIEADLILILTTKFLHKERTHQRNT